MNILAIDCSDNFCSTYLKINNQEFCKCDDINRGHVEHLIPQIAALLQSTNSSLADIDLYAVNSGPGSYTGTRVAIACIKALALSNKKQKTAINSFAPLAFFTQKTLMQKKLSIAAIIPAFGNNFYTVQFDYNTTMAGLKKISNYKIMNQEQLEDLSKKAIITYLKTNEMDKISERFVYKSPVTKSDFMASLAQIALKLSGEPVAPIYLLEYGKKYDANKI